VKSCTPLSKFIHLFSHSIITCSIIIHIIVCIIVAARSPIVSEHVTQLMRVKSSPRLSSDLFSHKIESERPVTVIRTDSSSQVTCTDPKLIYSNMFVPISVAEQFNYSEDELSTIYDYHTLQLLHTTEQQAPVFSETVTIDATDNQAVAVELLKLKKSTLDVQQKALPQGYKMVADVAGPQTFSETLSIDTCDHHAVAVELLKKKKSTLDVQQKALPQGYKMIAEVAGPQIFSETLSIDACDHQSVGVELLKKKKSTLDVLQKALPKGYTMIADVSGPQTFAETVSVDSLDRRKFGIELIKLKTSAMDIQRKALPKGVKLEAEILEPKTETTKLYVARTKCIEGIMEKPAEPLDEGSPPVFVVQLQSLQTMDGGNARLVCRVRGRPMPVSTEWSRDGKIIPTDNPELVATYDEVSGDASLTIAEVFPEDSGVYQCFAENKYGQAVTKAELIVEGTLCVYFHYTLTRLHDDSF